MSLYKLLPPIFQPPEGLLRTTGYISGHYIPVICLSVKSNQVRDLNAILDREQNKECNLMKWNVITEETHGFKEFRQHFISTLNIIYWSLYYTLVGFTDNLFIDTLFMDYI